MKHVALVRRRPMQQDRKTLERHEAKALFPVFGRVFSLFSAQSSASPRESADAPGRLRRTPGDARESVSSD